MPDKPTLLDTLTRARALIAASDSKDVLSAIFHAVEAGYREDPSMRRRYISRRLAGDAVLKATRSPTAQTLWEWQSMTGRTVSDILAALDRAIAACDNKTP